MPRITRPPPTVVPRTSGPSPAAPSAVRPAEAYASIDSSYTSPAVGFEEQHKGAFPGYRFDPAVFDDVMKRYCVGDAFQLMQTAVALDCGNRYLSREELTAAARQETAYVTKGYRFSPSVLADVMQQKGVAEKTALLRAATKLEDGDKNLSRPELERAADLLLNLVSANDLGAIYERVDALRGRDDVGVDDLGLTEGLPVPAVRLPCTGGEAKLRVVVTGGVHGNEPCGAAAAVLLIEQLLANPRLREDMEITIIPVVNPRGLVQGSRKTPEDVDLNRVFDGSTPTVEVDLMKGYLEDKPYDLGIDLHSGKAKRNGFWVLHRDAEELLQPAFRRFTEQWPVLHRDTKPYDMETPGIATSSSTSTLKDFHMDNGARWSITVEAPGSVSYVDQVLGENELMHEIIVEARGRAYGGLV